jgi:hypothetical protein
MESKWPLKKAMIVLVGSVMATCLLTFAGYTIYSGWKARRFESKRFTISAIIQTGSEKEALRSAYLSELLGLSIDCPKNIYALNLKKAELDLLSSPLIAKAKVKRRAPDTLYVDYEVRKPIAWLSDYRNTAIDSKGYLFPVAPFLSPKEMPEIYIGLPSFGKGEDHFGRTGGKWGEPLQNKHLKLAFDLLQTFEGSPWKEGLRIKRIDVSNAFSPTLGRREVVLFTEEEILLNELSFVFPKILRLAPRDCAQQLQNFFALRRSMIDDYRKQLSTIDHSMQFAPRIVDLRVPQLAFVEN